VENILFVYHYHATAQTKDGLTSTYDGIIEVKKEIDSMKDYNEVKDWIAMRNPIYVRNTIAITSLNFLNIKVQ
jgi:hypothetical protein